MTDNSIAQKLQGEIDAWRDLLGARPSLAEVQPLFTRVETLNALLVEAEATFSATLEELNSFPSLVTATLEQTRIVLNQTTESFLGTARELAISLGDRATEVLERTAENAAAEFAEMRDFVTDEFLDKVLECYQTNVATVCETCSELRDDVEEQLEEFVETTKEQVTELTDKLDELGEEWKGAVSELGGEFKDVCGKIVSLGEDVKELTDAIDTALQGTAVGINAATRSIDDIKAIMGGIV